MNGRFTQMNTSTRKYATYSAGRSFLDIIVPRDIAHIVSIIKNTKDMWNHDIRMQELGAEAMRNPE